MSVAGPLFDPYWKWLGISPKDQPPHHYRLLGIEPFESDAEVIANAADQRMLIVKSFQAGKHSEVSQRILNEIAAARICLLNPQKKVAYDQRLTASLGDRVPGASAAEIHLSENGLSAIRFQSRRSAARRRHTPAMLSIIVTAAAVVAVLVVLLSGRPGRDLVKNALSTATKTPAASHASPTASPSPRHPSAKLRTQSPEAPTIAQHPQELKPRVDRTEASQSPTASSVVEAGRRASAPPAAPLQPAPSGAPAAGRSKLPVPDQAAADAWGAQIRGQIYREELAAAKTNQQKTAVAEKLRRDGLATRDDPPSAFVLLRMAAELAAEGQDLSRALQTVNQIAFRYEIDRLAMKAHMLDVAAKAALTDHDVAVHRQIADRAQQLADAAMKQLRPELAHDLLKQAFVSARHAKDRQFAVAIQNQIKSVERLEGRIASARGALNTLAQKPDDATANRIVGTTYCFALGAWNEGLPYLAKANDLVLRALATADLARPQTPKAQADLGDRWWKFAEEKKGVEKQRIREQAVRWYRQALPKLTGITRTKVEKLLASMDNTPPSYALVFDGQESVVGVPGVFYDGQTPITIEAIVTPASKQSEMGVVGNILDEGCSQRQRAGLELGVRRQRWCFSICTMAGPNGPYHLYRLDGDVASPGRTAHVAAVYDGREARLYASGRLVAATATEGIHKPSPLALVIGAGAIQAGQPMPVRMGRHFAGVIDVVRLSAIARYDHQGFVPPEELPPDRDTALLLKFDQGRGDVVVSQVGGRRIRSQLNGVTWMDRQQWREELGSLNSR